MAYGIAMAGLRAFLPDRPARPIRTLTSYDFKSIIPHDLDSPLCARICCGVSSARNRSPNRTVGAGEGDRAIWSTDGPAAGRYVERIQARQHERVAIRCGRRGVAGGLFVCF